MPDHQAILLLAHGTPDVLSEMAAVSFAKVTGGRAHARKKSSKNCSIATPRSACAEEPLAGRSRL